MLDDALAYAARGWRVLPLRGKAPDGRLVAHGVDDATTDAETIRCWWKIEPGSNIGLAVPDDVLVLDVDTRNGGMDTLDRMAAQIPPTVTCETGGGGLHFYFRGNGKSTNGRLGAGLDTKSGSGYLVVPPSIHPGTGKQYFWRPGCGLDEHDLAPAPTWLLEQSASATNGPAPRVENVIPEGKRDSTLASLAGTMRRRGMSETAILAAIREENATRCRPPLPDTDLERIARSIGRYEPAETLGKSVYNGPPTALSETLAMFQHWLYLPDPIPLLATLGTVAANRLDGDPVWLGLVAPPSSAKTEILRALALLPDVHFASTLTPAGLLSGTPKKERASGAKGGLLRQVGDFGILVMKDFGSVLSLRSEAKAEVLAGLREIYDGHWTRIVGTEGGRTLDWQGKLGFLFGATPALDSHHAVIGAMGERFVLVRMAAGGREQARLALRHRGTQTAVMRQELAEAVAALFAGEPTPVDELDPDAVEEILELAHTAARMRSAVERDRYSREVESIHGAEGPARLTVTMEQLAQGLGTIGVDPPTTLDVLRRIALDSVPPLRREALKLLQKHGKAMETSAVATAIGLPTKTAGRALEDLAAYDLVIRHKQGSGKADLWEAVE